jgi:hypothetical protein
MDDSEINDVRLQKEFKGASFSKFQKQKVKQELIANIYNCKIEGACYWSAELICAGYFIDLWEIIINYVGKYIHIGNPKLPIYIQLRFSNFKDILVNGYVDNEIKMRNNDKIRKLFAELICVLAYSPKKHSFESIKIKNDEFDITQLTNRLKAKHISYSKEFFLPEDPKELFIPINEFAYHISKDSNNSVSACYWLEWIIQFELICNGKKQKTFCERREFIPVASASQKDLIWIIWDGILKETAVRKNKLLTKIVQALLEIFCIKYTNSSKTKRKYIIYNAISLLTETINYNIKIISNEDIISNITKKINLIYKDIKKNEIAPDTDYLFNGLDKKSNLEKTIERIEKMNEIDILPQREN